MPVNKYSFIRYRALDKCLRDHSHRYYISDLVDACNAALDSYNGASVSERQVRADMAFMQREAGGGAPIEKLMDGHRAYYRYSDPDYSILNLPMSQGEFNQLSSTIQMLGRFKGLPDNSWMEATLYRLQSTFNIDNTNPSWVRFSQNEELEGLRHFSRLFEAISKCIVLRIDYHKFGSDSWSREIHPYQLRQYNNRWFLVGYEENQSKGLPLVVLPLDRIDTIQECEDKEFKPFVGDIEKPFEDIVGVSLMFGVSRVHILIRAYRPTADYIKTKPIHHSQQIKDVTDEYIDFSLDLIPNYEFETIMLTYADNCEILEPSTLREKISERAALIEKMQKNCISSKE